MYIRGTKNYLNTRVTFYILKCLNVIRLEKNHTRWHIYIYIAQAHFVRFNNGKTEIWLSSFKNTKHTYWSMFCKKILVSLQNLPLPFLNGNCFKVNPIIFFSVQLIKRHSVSSTKHVWPCGPKTHFYTLLTPPLTVNISIPAEFYQLYIAFCGGNEFLNILSKYVSLIVCANWS